MKRILLIVVLMLGIMLSLGDGAWAATLGEKCPLDDPCEDPYECVSGVCKNPGLPVTDPVVGPCRNDTDCPVNYICEDSACTPRSPSAPVGPCRNDSDCPVNYICEQNACTPRTRTPGGNTGTGGNTGSPTSQAPGRDLTIQDVFNIIVGLTCWLTRIAIFLIVIFLLYYGFLFMKAQGDPTKITDAKKAFLWGIVGIIVILGTYSIIATVAYTVGGTAARINPIPINCSGVR
jgi:hypothetical protein